MAGRLSLLLVAIGVVVWSAKLPAQLLPPGAAGPPPTPQASAPIDLTGV